MTGRPKKKKARAKKFNYVSRRKEKKKEQERLLAQQSQHQACTSSDASRNLCDEIVVEGHSLKDEVPETEHGDHTYCALGDLAVSPGAVEPVSHSASDTETQFLEGIPESPPCLLYQDEVPCYTSQVEVISECVWSDLMLDPASEDPVLDENTPVTWLMPAPSDKVHMSETISACVMSTGAADPPEEPSDGDASPPGSNVSNDASYSRGSNGLISGQFPPTYDEGPQPVSPVCDGMLPVELPVGAELLNPSKFPHWSVERLPEGLTLQLKSRDKARLVQRSLFIPFSGLGVELSVHGQLLPKSHPSYRLLPGLSLYSTNAETFLAHVENCVMSVSLANMSVCLGASDSKYKKFWKKEKDTFIDRNSFHETSYQETCRSSKCLYLVPYPRKHCEQCAKILSRFRNRKSPTIDVTATPSKFKPFSCLDSAEKEKRQKRSSKRIVNLMRKNKRLLRKLQSLIDDESVELDEDLHEEVSAALENPDWGKVKEQMEDGTSEEEKEDTVDFFKIFIEQQVKAHKLKKKCGMKWHPLLIRFALLIKTLSTSTYRAMRQFVELPSERTLYDYSHVYKTEDGVQQQFINELSESLETVQHDYQRYFTLMFDEIFIHQSLAINKVTGQMVGYCKLTEVQSEVAELKNKLKAEAEGVPYQPLTTPPMAKRILAYMVKGTAGGGKTSVAHFGVSTLTKEDLFEYTWEVVEHLEMSGIRVIVMTADGCEVNRAFFKMHSPFSPPSDLSPDIVFDTPNRYAPERPVYFVSDVPHAIKTARNNLENSGTKRNMTKNGEPLLWSTIVSLFHQKSTQTVKYLHKLTWETVFLNSYSRMNVSYAARVLSKSVANALDVMQWPNCKELSIFKNIE